MSQNYCLSLLAIRRKRSQIQAQLDELGMETLQERLESAAQTPASPPYRLASLIQVSLSTWSINSEYLLLNKYLLAKNGCSRSQSI